ncbi:glucodextranase DOMON-like domain-containing protein [Actinocrinis sp.]|uniref:glucodextranase DOMON-like domain-containing protein n=1 Tax=Actinocrinis sp. TaxID=1920516 RepID=UPI002D3EDAD0|nr:glucodextranase DOMON-like domain-containing protein [Actinocrinis sp.]HZP50656.1 glucodextranase DOMON-like domain-containing protein [Actinocrinis sp.]
MTRPSGRRSAALASAAAFAVFAAGGAAYASTAPATGGSASNTTASGTAAGAPGAPAYFDLARKDCLGTARDTTSKVWYTVAGGVLSDVYEPTIDNTNVSTLQYVVTDGSSFTDLQTRDMTYTVQSDATGMVCTVTSTDAKHGYRLTTTYLTDPQRDSVLMNTRLAPTSGSSTDVTKLHVFARVDAHVNGNGGGGTDNAGADTGVVDAASGVPVVYDTSTVSEAANRTYAVPTFMALTASSLGAASVGYAGTASDGLTQLDAAHALFPTSSAPNGHIVATEDVTPRAGGWTRGREFTLSLGFGRTQADAVSTASKSLRAPFGAVLAAYTDSWRDYDASLNPAPRSVQGIGSDTVRKTYWLDANVLKASEDKTFPGAVVASLASPWGQAVNAGALVNGKAVYFGSYREVFARDLYEAFTGLLADGDVVTARAATRFLLTKQQRPNGELPRNSLVNGQSAPDTGGDQLDETAYPILMAYLSGLGGDATLWSQHIKSAADFLVSHGPSFGVERWEEQSGYSVSTIAAEIAGLTAASAIAKRHGDAADAALYQATADDFQRGIKNWTVTTTGPDSASPYFIRLSKSGDPNAAITYNLGNGGPTLDQRTVIDGGFQELVRLGELSPSDATFRNSLSVLDKQISVTTSTGTGYYRYGNAAADGSADGYGDCSTVDSQTSCTVNGEPWPTTDVGTGHLWPVLSGERAESDLAEGDRAGASALLSFMIKSASGVGLVPEQVWEDPNLPAAPFGSDPTTASIGFDNGHPAGSASPLTWAQAQELRLIVDLGTHQTVDRPQITTARYVAHGAPGAIPVTITAPASGTTIEGGSTTVTGTTAPGASVVIASDDTDTGAAATTATTTADSSGAFSATASVGFGTNIITVAATAKAGATGYAQSAVVGDVVGGTTVLDLTDPAGDDNGPGTYQYPTSSSFSAGSFDLTRFQVITANGTVYLRTTLNKLTPTFGNVMGAQLLDVYVRAPGAASTSTAAAFPQRNYAIAASDAWSQRIEVQGFASPVWVDPGGNQVGTPTAVVASTVSNTITIALPQAQFGTPGSGWTFTLALTGQDGFSGDQARAFSATAQPYAFGVCAPGGTSPICAVDPAMVPKVMDTITPSGVSQATELDPTLGPVVLHGVTAP